MPKRKKGNPPLWSVPRVRDPRYPGWTVRITELTGGGGTLYACFRRDGKQTMRSLKRTRKDLGRTPKEQRERARAIALDIIEGLANPQDSDESAAEAPEALTLGKLADLYELHGLPGVGLSYAKVQVRKVRRFATFLGADRPVVSLCNSDIKRFAEHRAKEGVGLNTICGDLTGLKIALNFGLDYKRLNGTPLLAANPLHRVRVPHEEPHRPWTTPTRYQRLQDVSGQLPPAFRCLLALAWESGRRIGAILRLRWQDVSFRVSADAPHGTIRWNAGKVTDKKKRDETVPINLRAREALERYRERHAGIGASLIFPAPRNPNRALGHHVAAWWLRKAEELANLEHQAQGGWHQFRRGWATKRKHLPLKDVAAVGGWRDTKTLIASYMHEDAETILSVVNGGG